MKKILWICIVLLAGAAGLSAQTPVAEKNKVNVSKGADVSDDYVIGVNDVLSIRVWKEPELSIEEIGVRPDGMITVPLVGDIKAEGKTSKQMQDEIAAKLKEILTAPNVTVIILKAISRTVTMIGSVNSNIYALTSPTTIVDLLARAGGVGAGAKSKDIKIFRKENGKTITFKFNFKDFLKGKNLDQNILLKEGDQIVVP